MPTDNSVQTVVVDAPLREVLATLRDVDSQHVWIPEILESEVLTTDDAGLPATARFKAAATVGTDEYTLAYEHTETSISWTMLKGRMQTGQEGRYTLEPDGPNRTRVTYDLTIHHNLPLPGFIRNKVIKGLVASSLRGLQGQFAAV